MHNIPEKTLPLTSYVYRLKLKPGPYIAVIVLNWRGISDTQECMDSLLAQDCPNCEIILVDNGSGEEEQNRLGQLYGSLNGVRLHLNSENLGFTKAHNQIFEKEILPAEYDYIALLNNDAVAEPDWLRKLVEFAQENNCGMVASKMTAYFDRSKMDNAGHFMINTGEIVPLGFGKPVGEFSRSMENIGACAGACLLSVPMLRKIGFFDDRFHTGYEDAELGLRAFLCGEKPMYNPEAVVYHKMGQSLKKVRSEKYLADIQSHIFYTWFKLMPASIILWNLPAFVFKYSMVFLIDIFMLRLKFLKVMGNAMAKTLRQRKDILKARKDFHSRHPVLRPFREINARLVSFLGFDIRRFYHLVLKRKKSQLEA